MDQINRQIFKYTRYTEHAGFAFDGLEMIGSDVGQYDTLHDERQNTDVM